MNNKKILLAASVLILIILIVLVYVRVQPNEDNISENSLVNSLTYENSTINEKSIIEKAFDQEDNFSKQEEPKTNKYPLHKNIWTTYFYIGEPESEDNGYISNVHSAWDERWVEHFGGIDDPECRGYSEEDSDNLYYPYYQYYPCKFVPKENPFYCALPYGEVDDEGRKDNIAIVPWYNEKDNDLEDDIIADDDMSIIKNRWIKVMFKEKAAYCQCEDVGPGESDDVNYVFGTSQPLHSNSGLDVSPAMKDYLGMDGHDIADWQFVDEEDVPEGPWTEIITKSGTCWVYEGSECE